MTSTFTSLPTAARAYVTVTVCAGTAAIAHSVYSLSLEPVGWTWTILAVLTLVSGSATIQLPSMPATISVSETFVFTSVLLFGVAAGTLTVVLDALVISFWAFQRKRQPLYKSVFNVTALALTIWLASQLFFIVSETRPLALTSDPVALSKLLLPLLLFTVTYFLLNSWIITFAISLERNLAPAPLWREHFLWLSLNYFGGASVAVLLVSYTHNLDLTYILLILPLLIVLYFTFSMSMGRVEDANRHLAALNTLYMSTIETLAMAIDAKDQVTHGHIRRVQTYAVGLAKRMGIDNDEMIRAIEAAALLHDMGKLAVPEYILNKPGPLTPAEFDKMKMHAAIGADILSAIDFPYPVVPIVRHHHENWNGTGYPDSIAGTNIPIGARILSVVDCFDALTSDRPYRPRLSDKDAIRILTERRGTMYDPLVVDTFLRVHAEIAPSQTADEPSRKTRPSTTATAGTVPSLAVERFDRISGGAEEMLTLFSLARGLVPVESLPAVADVVARHLKRLIPSSLLVIYMNDCERNELVAKHAVGGGADQVMGLRIPIGERLSGWVGAHRHTIRNSDPLLDFGDAARSMSPPPRCCLSTPLVVEDQLVGVLSLYSTHRDAFSEEHQRIAEIVAEQVTPTLQHATHSERESIGLVRDRVTGLPQLDQFRSAVESQVSAATKERPVSVLLVSVPRNADTAAEPQFDSELASAMVSAVRDSLRPTDMLFQQHGGDLFALLLHTDRSASNAIANRVVDATSLLHSRFAGRGAVDGLVLIASAPADGRTIDELLEGARQRRRLHTGGQAPSRGNDSPIPIH